MTASIPPYDPRVIANYLLNRAEMLNEELTQLKLLKLYYFSYACYLIEKKKPLAKNDIEAWKLGPVSRSIRKEFSNFGAKPITSRACTFNIYTGETEYACPSIIHPDDRRFIDGVLDIYGKHIGTELSDISHEEGSPWDVIWNGKDNRARLSLRIKDIDIIKHFDF